MANCDPAEPMRARSVRPAPAARGACPVCERYIGPVAVCPYCGEDGADARTLRILRGAALALAALGLLLLYAGARQRPLPVIRTGSVSPAMGYATVRAEGRVDRAPYMTRRDGTVRYLAFNLDDGSGPLRVTAENGVARALVEQGRIPAAGARAAVRGRIQVDMEGRARLRVQAADHVSVLGLAPEAAE